MSQSSRALPRARTHSLLREWSQPTAAGALSLLPGFSLQLFINALSPGREQPG